LSLRQLLEGGSFLNHGPTRTARRAADTARWRARLAHGRACYTVEIDREFFDFMVRRGFLRDSKASDRKAVTSALGRLLYCALATMLREEAVTRHTDRG
jgi:hypothetical protein